MTTPSPQVRSLTSDALQPAEVATIRQIMRDAFGDGDEGFTDDDWEHALGGRHFVLEVDGEIVTHAAVVERELRIADRAVRTGYVEAVATAPAHQGRGYGTSVMEAATAYVAGSFDLGALGTSRHAFYGRLGWDTWAGPSFVRTVAGLARSADEDGCILVLRTPSSFDFAGTEPISCDDRAGDAW